MELLRNVQRATLAYAGCEEYRPRVCLVINFGQKKEHLKFGLSSQFLLQLRPCSSPADAAAALSFPASVFSLSPSFFLSASSAFSSTMSRICGWDCIRKCYPNQIPNKKCPNMRSTTYMDSELSSYHQALLFRLPSQKPSMCNFLQFSFLIKSYEDIIYPFM